MFSTVLDRVNIDSEEIRQFTRQKWKESRESGMAGKPCEECQKRWHETGRARGEERPLFYPPSYKGPCRCGHELGRVQIPGI
jgi:hypothetical protein